MEAACTARFGRLSRYAPSPSKSVCVSYEGWRRYDFIIVGGLNKVAAVGFALFSPIYGPITYGSAIGMTNGVADYLKRVQKDSTIGSWIGENLCVSTYNHIADYVESSDMPSEYDSLFNQQ